MLVLSEWLGWVGRGFLVVILVVYGTSACSMLIFRCTSRTFRWCGMVLTGFCVVITFQLFNFFHVHFSWWLVSESLWFCDMLVMFTAAFERGFILAHKHVHCGPSEIRLQLKFICHYLQGFSTIPGGCLGFLNHQQHLNKQPILGIVPTLKLAVLSWSWGWLLSMWHSLCSLTEIVPGTEQKKLALRFMPPENQNYSGNSPSKGSSP